jgi:hypothetical protein
MKRFSNRGGLVKYSDFCAVMMPIDSRLTQLVIDREKMDKGVYSGKDSVNKIVIQGLRNFLEYLILSEREIEDIRKSIFNSRN